MSLANYVPTKFLDSQQVSLLLTKIAKVEKETGKRARGGGQDLTPWGKATDNDDGEEFNEEIEDEF